MGRALRRTVGLLWGAIRLIAVVVALAVMAVGVLVAVTTQRGFAQVSGTISVPGLHDTTTVTRDRAGIIQITAKDGHDLFLAQGYVHAQERMWQMEISRR